MLQKNAIAPPVKVFAASRSLTFVRYQGNRNPGRSGLAHSAVPYASGERLSTSDEDDEQGHITPAVAAIGTGAAARGTSEKPKWAEYEPSKGKKNRRWLWAALAALLIIAIGLGVGLGVG